MNEIQLPPQTRAVPQNDVVMTPPAVGPVLLRPPPSPPHSEAGLRPTAEGAPEQKSFELWVECQKIAMHFNDLILNFRLKALGGIAIAAGLVVDVAARSGNVASNSSLVLLSSAFLLLLVVWIAIWLLDLRYYDRLLNGAVEEALQVERESGGRLFLSTRLVKRIQGDDGSGGLRMDWGRRAFYLLPLAGLALCASVPLIFVE